MALNVIKNAVTRHKKESFDLTKNVVLKNIKGDTVLMLKRFDTNTWILNPGSKNEEIVKIELEEQEGVL